MPHKRQNSEVATVQLANPNGPKWTIVVHLVSCMLKSDPEIQAPPHKIDDQHRECKTGSGAYFAFFLGSENSHTTPPKNVRGRDPNC